MSKNIFVTAVLILFLMSALWFISKSTSNEINPLLNPNVEKTAPAVVNMPTPSPTPISFEFDRTTDLQQELELINPVVLESDF